MPNPDQMKRIREERQSLDPQMRQVKALEQIADSLMFMQGEFAGMKMILQSLAQTRHS